MELDAPTVIRMPDILGRELVHPLEREIIRMRFPPGMRLVEEEICRRFGVSRSPVREALQVLASRGLVERRPRRGMFVMEMTVERLDEIYACRGPLEGLASEGVARRATPELAASLQGLVDDMAGAGRDGRKEAAFDANVALTDLLHAHCGNATLQTILKDLDTQALRYRYYCYRENDDIIDIGIEANRRLVAAIAAGDGARARTVTEGLIARSWALIRDVLVAHTAADATGATGSGAAGSGAA